MICSPMPTHHQIILPDHLPAEQELLEILNVCPLSQPPSCIEEVATKCTPETTTSSLRRYSAMRILRVLQGCSVVMLKKWGSWRGSGRDAIDSCTVMLFGIESNRRLYVETRMAAQAARRGARKENEKTTLESIASLCVDSHGLRGTYSCKVIHVW